MGEWTHVLRTPTLVEQWCELLGGTMEVAEARVFLRYEDIWAITGLGIVRRATFNLVAVIDRKQFDRWVRSAAPRLEGEMLEAYDAACALRELEPTAVWPVCCGSPMTAWGSEPARWRCGMCGAILTHGMEVPW